MKKTACLAFLVFAALFMITGPAWASTYYYSFSVNDGPATAVTPLTGTQSASAYYNYYSSKPHPVFGAEDGTAFFWLYLETDTNILSLGAVFDAPGGTGGYGDAYFSITGLPIGWEWVVQDDNSDIGTNTDTTPTWHWDKTYGDGGMISGLEDALFDIVWTAYATSSHFYGISNWYFLSGEKNAGKYDNPFILNPADTLTISSSNVPPSAVPVPSAILLLAAGLAGLAGVSRKK